MNLLISTLFGPWLAWLPSFFFWIVLILAGLRYARYPHLALLPKWLSPSFRRLAWATIGFRIGYAAALTAGQYLVWTQSEFTRSFLSSSISSSLLTPVFARFFGLFSSNVSYFFVYAAGRWWLNVIFSLAIAFAFYGFLRLLERHNPRFFEAEEVHLGLLAALLAGWPGVVILLPLLFGSVVLVSLYRIIALREPYTTLGAPLLLAAAAALLGGQSFLRAIGLGVLWI